MIESKWNVISGIVGLFFSKLLYWIYRHLILAMGIIATALSINSGLLEMVCVGILGVAYGLICRILLYVYKKIKYEKQYDMVEITRITHCIQSKMEMIREEDEKDTLTIIRNGYKTDLEKIRNDYCSPENFLSTKTHLLFVKELIEGFIDEGAGRTFAKDFKDVDKGTKKIYKSPDNSVEIIVEYYKNKTNGSNAIKRHFYSWKSLKKDWRRFKKDSRKVQYFKVNINFY